MTFLNEFGEGLIYLILVGAAYMYSKYRYHDQI